MPLLDYISGNKEDQQSEIEDFLSGRWGDVIDEAPVLSLREKLDSYSWYAKSFGLGDFEVGSTIRANFSFKAVGSDEADRLTGEEINGEAVVLIDEYDNIEFTDVQVDHT